MFKHFLNIVILLVALNGAAQDKLLTKKVDSIDLKFRTSGFDLDSLDVAFGGNENLRPGGFLITEFDLNKWFSSFDQLGQAQAGLSYLQRNIRARNYKSPLPYMGVQYSFGTKITQHLNFEYAQQFNKNSNLNLRYKRDGSTGLLRRGDYKLNDLNIVYTRKGKRLYSHLDALYSNYSWQENGGITTDTLIEEFAIEFTPVYKPNAETKVKKIDANFSNYFNITQDSILKTGFFQQSRFESINREYSEIDTISKLYANIYLDSSKTRDQYQTASIKNGGGYFFSSPLFQIDASINHRYWRNQNLGINKDTNEIFLQSHIYLGRKLLNLKNNFYFNLIGATGELKNQTTVHLNLNTLKITGQLNFSNLYPSPYLRNHLANNYTWKLNKLNPTQIVNLKGKAELTAKVKLGAKANFSIVNNGFYFINDKWRQDTLNNISTGNVSLYAKLNTTHFSIYPRATLRFNSNNFNYQPAFSLKTRLAYKAGLFKAEKLKIVLGIDTGFDSQYNTLLYNPVLSVYQPNNLNIKSGNLMNLDFFFNMEIDQFRFFTRVENIDYLWNPEKTRIDKNFPIMPLIVKMGISWDFFN